MKNKNRITRKRIAAYIIDIFIVSLITVMFSQIEYINFTLSDYDKVYNEYNSFMMNYSSIKDIATSSIINDINYDLTYLNVPNSIISLIVIMMYFVVFQYLNKGRTIGKAIMKLKVNNVNKNSVSLISLFLRYLVLSSIITGIASILLVSFCSKEVYLRNCLSIDYVEMFVLLITYGMFMFREDHRGLHDVLGSTVVVSTEKEAKVIKEIINKEEN